MRILVVGSGAREHVLAWKCMQSVLTDRVYCTPGNGGTGGMAKNIQIPADDVANLVKFAKREKIGLAILGPESAVAAGVGDALRQEGIPVFGPGRDGGRIESSKSYAKELMRRAGIPTADFGIFTEPAPAKDWARSREGRVVVKADGLALGKGVVVCASPEQAESAIDAMLVDHAHGRAGATIVVEERLTGPEVSLMAVTDGRRVRWRGTAAPTPAAWAPTRHHPTSRASSSLTRSRGCSSPPSANWRRRVSTTAACSTPG